MPDAPLLAILVGGRSRRMGRPKGLLPSPYGTGSILQSLVDAGVDAGYDVVLVGESAPYDRVAREVPRIDDDPPGYGPLAGLRAAQRHARRLDRSTFVLVACDMPYVRAETLRSLRSHPSDALVLAPRRSSEGPWEPMLGRYDSVALGPVLDDAIADGVRSFQVLFKRLPAEALPLTGDLRRALHDWDTPGDIES